MTMANNKVQAKQREQLTQTIERLEKKLDQSQEEMNHRLESRLEWERKEQDKRFEMMMTQNARAQKEMRRISLETNKMITKHMSNTKITIETETQKVSQQIAQTALDLVEIKCRLHTMDMDLQATREVAASASRYLAWATADYKTPDSVEIELIISPEVTPSKASNKNNNINERSPPFGEA